MMFEYSFDEGEGSIANDVAGVLPLSGVPAWAEGRYGGSAMRVEHVAAPSFSPFTVDSAFTIMFDLYLVGPGNNNYNVVVNSPKVGNIQFNYQNALDWYRGSNSNGHILPYGEWRHFAFAGAPYDRQIYVEGLPVGNHLVTDGNGSGTDPLTLGGFGGYEPNMIMDNLRVSDQRLSAEEILELSSIPVGGVELTDPVIHTVQSAYLGDRSVTRIYAGDTQVWPLS